MGGYYLMLHAGRARIAYAESVEQVPANMAEVRPDRHVLGAAPLREDVRARHEKVAADPPAAAEDLPLGAGRGPRGLPRTRWRAPRPGPLLAAASTRWRTSSSSPRSASAPAAGCACSSPAARRSPREIAEFFGAAGLLILEGYGLTETSPVITVNRPDALRPGTVGQPIPGVEVKIADDGEILTRGPHVMKGYYNKPEATAEAIDADGWFHTGDIGVLDARRLPGHHRPQEGHHRHLRAARTSRPSPSRTRSRRNPLIAEIVMIGNKRNFPSALVVPNFDNLEKWAREQGVAFACREELVARAARWSSSTTARCRS